MPIVSGIFDTSAAPVSGQCQTTYTINHYGRKIERRLVANNTLLDTVYVLNRSVSRNVACIDPTREEPRGHLLIKPEFVADTTTGVDLSGREYVDTTYALQMWMLADFRCRPCASPEVSGGSFRTYSVYFDGNDTSSQAAAATEYQDMSRFHRFNEWSPSTHPNTYHSPSPEFLEEIIGDYNILYGAAINAALGTSSFFSFCATETTNTGCVS